MPDTVRQSVSPVLATALSGTLVVGLAVLGAFWAMWDPRNDLRDIKKEYLPRAEHLEFKQRLDKEFEVLQRDFTEHQKDETHYFMSRADFERWVLERNKLIEQMQHDIIRLEDTRPQASELNAIAKGLESRVTQLENEMVRLRNSVKQ